MSSALLLRGARQLLTLRGPSEPRRGPALNDLAIIADGAVLVRDGIIESVGPSRRLENVKEARHAQEIDVSGRVVMPGFVDCHTHVVCGPMRAAESETPGTEAQEGPGGQAAFLRALRAARNASKRRLQLDAARRLRGFLRHGTTTVEAKSGYGLDRGSELRILRATAALASGPVDVIPTFFSGTRLPPEHQGRAEEYLAWLCGEMLPLVRSRRLARFAEVCCGAEAFTLEQTHAFLLRSKELGFGVKVHTSGRTAGAVRLAVELGAVSIDHLEHIAAEDLAALAAFPTIAVLLPGATFQQGCGAPAPARALIEAGAAIALATGYDPGWASCCNMAAMVALACTHLRMTPAEAISAATINAAHAIGLANRVGSIEPGKQADLIVLDASDYRELALQFGTNLVAAVIKRGRVVYRQGEVRWSED